MARHLFLQDFFSTLNALPSLLQRVSKSLIRPALRVLRFVLRGVMQNPDIAATAIFAEPQDQSDDGDSSYGDLAPSTVSLATSQYFFNRKNGRTYHTFQADREYMFPNDELEMDRMDMQFWAIHEIFGGKYFFSPIGDNPQHIIDIGTGTGTWAIDVGDDYPSALVRGTDLSPIQPSWVPPNVSFELHDCLQYPWEFNRKFDLIHTQILHALVIKDWDGFYREAYSNLLPGGWVESHEVSFQAFSPDNSLPSPSAIERWLEHMDVGLGGSRTSGQKLSESMAKAGLINITIKEFRLFMGPWDPMHRNAGMLSLAATTEHMEGLSMAVFMEKLGLTLESMREITIPAMREFKRRNVHCYLPLYAVYGMRPEDP